MLVNQNTFFYFSSRFFANFCKKTRYYMIYNKNVCQNRKRKWREIPSSTYGDRDGNSFHFPLNSTPYMIVRSQRNPFHIPTRFYETLNKNHFPFISSPIPFNSIPTMNDFLFPSFHLMYVLCTNTYMGYIRTAQWFYEKNTLNSLQDNAVENVYSLPRSKN